MLDFSADLATSFPHLPMLDRIDAAAAAGFKAVEAVEPYGVPADDMARRLKATGVSFVMLTVPSLDATASDPDGTAAFGQALDRAIQYAASIGCRYLTCPTAITAIDLSDAGRRDRLTMALRHAAARLMARSIRLLLEPVSGTAGPHDLAATLALLNEIGSRNLSMNCGFGRGHGWEPPLIQALERYLPRIGHIRIADIGRAQTAGEPGLATERLLASLDRLGYCGWIGCDVGRGDKTPNWLAPFFDRRPPLLTWHGEPSRRAARPVATA